VIYVEAFVRQVALGKFEQIMDKASSDGESALSGEISSSVQTSLINEDTRTPFSFALRQSRRAIVSA
jgi:hypothetical protein